MASPTGIIPESLMFPERKRDVIDLLKRLPLEARLKRNLLLGWAQTVGQRILRRDYAEVERSSIDQ